jgi:isopentenyl diphosphate isomerase/L-lactate dehydrogenase-like FMN-dependent dehydrogenase
LPDLVTVPEVIAAARAKLPKELWDFASGGAGAEITIRRNRSAIERYSFVPRMLRDEMMATAAMLGVSSLDELGPQHLTAEGTQVPLDTTAYGLGMSENDGRENR